MKIISCKVGHKAVIDEIQNHLYYLQKFVDGPVEVVASPTGYVLICNEEGKLNGLPMNPVMDFWKSQLWSWPEFISGDYFICCKDGEGFTDIPDNDATDDLIMALNDERKIR